MKTIYGSGWKIVWRIYSRGNLIVSLCLPIVLTVLSFIVCLLSKKEPIVFLDYVSSLILSIGPNMLGFTLSGYALMMGMSNSEFIQALINFREKDKEYSLYQSLNTVFAVVLGTMFVIILTGAFASIVIEAEIQMPYILSDMTIWYNWSCLFVLLFLMFYTINSIKDIVINIFNFGQFIQVYSQKSENDDDSD